MAYLSNIYGHIFQTVCFEFLYVLLHTGGEGGRIFWLSVDPQIPARQFLGKNVEENGIFDSI